MADHHVRRIAVFGATGNQGWLCSGLRSVTSQIIVDGDNSGGSVAKLLLAYPQQYAVRAVTRNPDSPGAKSLENLGAEIVKADLTVPADLPPVLEGCWGVFGVTNFYDAVCAQSEPAPWLGETC